MESEGGSLLNVTSLTDDIHLLISHVSLLLLYNDIWQNCWYRFQNMTPKHARTAHLTHIFLLFSKLGLNAQWWMLFSILDFTKNYKRPEIRRKYTLRLRVIIIQLVCYSFSTVALDCRNFVKMSCLNWAEICQAMSLTFTRTSKNGTSCVAPA